MNPTQTHKPPKAKNAKLNRAIKLKNDEFYTQLETIEKEMVYHLNNFENKVVYLNCDNPRFSKFWTYFSENFDKLKLKKLIATYYIHSALNNEASEQSSEKWELTKNGTSVGLTITPLQGDGDFRSPECLEILRTADVVVTNPPFSLFREYMQILFDYEKEFLILGNLNAYTYRHVFERIVDGRVKIGMSVRNGEVAFKMPEEYSEYLSNVKVTDEGHWLLLANARWFTTFAVPANPWLELSKTFNENEYPKFLNEKFKPISPVNVDRTIKIPYDYSGVMGVPITFLDKWNPNQFKIVTDVGGGLLRSGLVESGDKVIQKYVRIAIQKI